MKINSPRPLALILMAAVLSAACPAFAQVQINPDALGPDAGPKPAAKAKPPVAKPAAVKPPSQKPKPAKPDTAQAVVPVDAPAPPMPPPVLAPPPVPAAAVSGPERDRTDLQRVSAYLNSVRTMKGGFVQVGPNGELDQGAIYLNKPGRMRFEYAKPSPYLIVADGVSVAVGNSNLKTVDRYPLIDNPLSMILDDDIDLTKKIEISRIEHKPGQLIVTAKHDGASMKGQVTLIFAEPNLELKQWVVTDAQGLQTMTTLQNVETGVTLEPELFILRDVNKFADPRE